MAARMKFICDTERCIDCNGCVTACKNEHEIPWGINRRRVVTINDGVPGERSVSVACMHCTDAPCLAVCPVNCIAEGKLPACAEMCGTKALLAGDADTVARIYRQRVETRGYGPELWGWKIAYGRPKRGGDSQMRGDLPRENQQTSDAQNDPWRIP